MVKNKTVIWSLATQNSNGKSYLMGTMHARSEEAYAHLRIATSCLNSCKVFAGEIDLGKSQTFNSEFYLKQGNTLSKLLGLKSYVKYAKIIKRAFDFDLDQLDNFKPLVAQNIILENLIAKSNALPLDFKLYDIAKDSAKILIGIETIEEQNTILNSIPIQLQLKMFKDAFTKVNKMKKALNKTIILYAEGDIQSLFKESKKGLGKLRKIMLYNRNKIMAHRILELIKNDAVFVAIGAAHLGGKYGVLNLLNEKGVKILPVYNI